MPADPVRLVMVMLFSATLPRAEAVLLLPVNATELPPTPSAAPRPERSDDVVASIRAMLVWLLANAAPEPAVDIVFRARLPMLSAAVRLPSITTREPYSAPCGVSAIRLAATAEALPVANCWIASTTWPFAYAEPRVPTVADDGMALVSPAPTKPSAFSTSLIRAVARSALPLTN